jgi:peptide/nickel transport system permease protein
MSKTEKTTPNQEMEIPQNGETTEEMHLDDARRVKVLSPGMLVFKRFIRNKLAVIGFGILFFMFTFSFLGPFLSPYTQTEVFSGTGTMSKDFAGAIYNKELRYTVAPGQTFGSAERAQFLLALSKNEETFTYNDIIYFIVKESEGTYRIVELSPVAEVMIGKFRSLTDEPISEEMTVAYQEAIDNDLNYFQVGDTTYIISKAGKAFHISTATDMALGMLNVYDPYNQKDTEKISSFDFKLLSNRAISEQQPSFTVNGEKFTIKYGEGQVSILDSNGADFAEVSDIIVNPLDQTIFLDVKFKAAARQAIDDTQNTFSVTDQNGVTTDYTIARVNTNYYIKTVTTTELIRTYEEPSADHLLGLDNNGMDLMTRLMYGGRVSLLVGFIVVFIEVFLGVIIGGISGYFGGAIDTALMRFVDLFNSIPFWPMVLIFGSVMDALEVKPMARIFLLMMVLGILGWTGVARVVRGQILSLREQDFMVATEATGIRTSRRIFKHLVPNVMPLLIVQATAGLGGVIITEATLGFLGLGVKYPLASWGSIINVASDAFVMTNFWFMWIPAGLLILLTVLGFNFVGDGLRDAYDPKMKR